jgi:HAD superfamily hydrolase (TIGR01509 family)
MILAVIFDMGDILYDASQWRRAMAARLQEQGVAIDFPAFREQWEAKLVAVYQGKREYWDALHELLSELLSASGPAAVRETLDFGRQMAKIVGERRKPFPGVVETLPALRQMGLRLAVLSDTENGQARLRSTLAQLGIEPFFDAIVASCEIGHCKPSIEAFKAAAAAVATPVDHCAFVGHDLDELSGAMAAGMFSIAYNFEPGVPADAYVAHFSELPDVIAARQG